MYLIRGLLLENSKQLVSVKIYIVLTKYAFFLYSKNTKKIFECDEGIRYLNYLA